MENITRIEMECKYQYIVYGISINSSCQNEFPRLTSWNKISNKQKILLGLILGLWCLKMSHWQPWGSLFSQNMGKA